MQATSHKRKAFRAPVLTKHAYFEKNTAHKTMFLWKRKMERKFIVVVTSLTCLLFDSAFGLSAGLKDVTVKLLAYHVLVSLL